MGRALGQLLDGPEEANVDPDMEEVQGKLRHMEGTGGDWNNTVLSKIVR
jgi:hypothetical protein